VIEESFEDLYEHAPCAYLSTLPDGTIVRVNGTFTGWTGHRAEDLIGKRRFADLLTAGGRIFYETHFVPLLRMHGEVREIALEMVCADGRRWPVLVNAVLHTDDEGRPAVVRTTMLDARDRQRYERELMGARRREQEARAQTERLQRLTARLAGAVDAHGVAEALVDELMAAIPTGGAGVAVVGRDRRSVEVLAQRGEADDDPPPIPRAPQFAHDAGRAVLPLAVHSQVLGVAWVDLTGTSELGEDIRALLVAFAAQAALALERVRLHDQTRRVAVTFQRSLLEHDPLPDPRVAVATRYLPAVEGLEVGGDWYDAFAIDRDVIALAVGDVVGRGIEAATAMGQLRSAIRALAPLQLGPAGLLERLNEFAERLEAAELATLVYAEVALDTGTVIFAVAGHPPPIVVQPATPPHVLWGARTTPLITYITAPPRHSEVLELAPGARLVLYTDGLVERADQPLDEGIDRLVRELEARREASLEALVHGLTESMLDAAPGGDDVCLLCFEFAGSGPTGARARFRPRGRRRTPRRSP
jgi:PAS domain S-box-containing protein